MAEANIATQQIAALAESSRQLVAAHNAELKAMKQYTDALNQSTEALEAYELELTKGQELTDDENKLLQKALVAKQKELQITNSLNAANKRLQDMLQQRHKIAKEDPTLGKVHNRLIREQIQQIRTLKSSQAAASAGSAASAAQFAKMMSGAVVALRVFTGILGIIVGAILGQYELQKKLMVANQGFIEGTDNATQALMRQQELATLRAKVEPVEFAKIITSSRQMVNALGGNAKVVDLLSESQHALYAMTGNFADALKAANDIAQSLIYSGFRPTQQAMEAYIRDLKDLHILTGRTEAELRGMFDEIAKDTDSLTLLRAAREDEREAILASQRALFKLGVEAGMTAEQARDAAKMLNKMVAAKPLERIKQAAKMRAFGAAFGIAGSEEAARAVLAGPRATADQKKSLQQFSMAATSFADQARGAGMATEIAVTTLLDKLDLEQYYGPGSTFSTTLGQQLQNNAGDLLKQFIDIAKDPLAKVVQTEEWARTLVEWAAVSGGWLAIISNHLKDILEAVRGMWASIKHGFGWVGDKMAEFWLGFKSVFLEMFYGLAEALGKVPGLGSLTEWATEGRKNLDKEALRIGASTQPIGDRSALVKKERELEERQRKLEQRTTAAPVENKQVVDEAKKTNNTLEKQNALMEEGNAIAKKTLEQATTSAAEIKARLEEAARMDAAKRGLSYHDLVR